MEYSRSLTGQEPASRTEVFPEEIDLEALSDEEVEAMLFGDEAQDSSHSWNLPTVAGLSMILVGVVYLLQELGLWNGIDVSVLASMLPWLAGVFIILLGFGVLSWHPGRKKKPPLKESAEAPTGEAAEATRKKEEKSRITKSATDKKIAGVCAGLADYINIDVTLVRIAFVFGTIVSGGPPFIAAYLALMYVMPNPDPMTPLQGAHATGDHAAKATPGVGPA